jgi:Icc-related predicted phosphoesterase
MLRIFFASDVHGSEITFRKFLNAPKLYKANVAILGGDLTGKWMVPIFEENGIFRAKFLGQEYIAKGSGELEKIKKDIRFQGGYPYLTTLEEFEELRKDPEKADKKFSKLMVETMECWVKIADERLKNSGIKVFILPGNDDRHAIDVVLEKAEHVINPEGRVCYIDDIHEMISTGYTNITPWNAPRDISEEELNNKIELLCAEVQDMKNCIFCFHCPPYGTQLDRATQIDKDFRPVAGASGTIATKHVGSVSVRNAIEKYQPLLSLHGHIHESRGVCKINRTLCINPGSEYLEGILRGALIELDEKGVKSYTLTSG